MPVVPNCTNCGAPMQADRSSGAFVCRHCGTLEESPAAIVDCWQRHDCPPVIVFRVDIDNPPADLASKAQVDSVFQPTYPLIAGEIVKSFFD